MTVGKSGIFLSVISYVLFGAIFMCAAVMIGVYANRLYETDQKSTFIDTNTHITPRPLVIDPGHGGEDGGASSADGIVEKELNLNVADNIAYLCVTFGVPYKMTREDDRLLYDYYSEYSDYTGKKKSLDLKNRLRFTEECDAMVFLSIHMNKFTDARYKGLQVYYSPNHADSRSIAEIVQNYVKTYIQMDNNREVKRATSSIYLLNRMTMPAILVECGFLSNTEDANNLNTESYRADISCAVFSPVLEYMIRNNA